MSALLRLEGSYNTTIITKFCDVCEKRHVSSIFWVHCTQYNCILNSSDKTTFKTSIAWDDNPLYYASWMPTFQYILLVTIENVIIWATTSHDLTSERRNLIKAYSSNVYISCFQTYVCCFPYLSLLGRIMQLSATYIEHYYSNRLAICFPTVPSHQILWVDAVLPKKPANQSLSTFFRKGI